MSSWFRPLRPLIVLMVCVVGGGEALAEQLFQLRNGLVLRGSKAEIASLKELAEEDEASRAASAAFLSSMIRPPLVPPSAVISMRAPASSILSRRAFAEKPPNTTECTAPILAQACIAITASGTIGI